MKLFRETNVHTEANCEHHLVVVLVLRELELMDDIAERQRTALLLDGS